MNNRITVALADDHVLIRKALASLIDDFEGFKVVLESSNGEELIQAIEKGILPQVVLLDLNMPVKNGYETAAWLKDNQPEILVLMLTMYDSEPALIRLLQAGVKGFLKKDIHPAELKSALQSVVDQGYYYSSRTTGKLANLFRESPESNTTLKQVLLSTQETRFLQLACSEMTYKEIAMEMGFNPRSVDTLRDHLFNKLEVKSRVGLAIYALRHGLVTFD